jgi:uncharacterized heparinase superfamily protein
VSPERYISMILDSVSDYVAGKDLISCKDAGVKANTNHRSNYVFRFHSLHLLKSSN